MTQRCLYVGDKLSSELMLQLTATDGGVVQVTRLTTALTEPVLTSLQLSWGQWRASQDCLTGFGKTTHPREYFVNCRLLNSSPVTPVIHEVPLIT